MAQEKVRKSSRRLDEAKELQDKVTVKDKLYFNQRATANKEVKAATKSLEDRNSAEGKKVGQKLLAKVTEKRDNISKQYKQAHAAKVKADAKIEKLKGQIKLLKEKYASTQLAKKRTDERTVKAEHECAATKNVNEGIKEKYDSAKAKFEDMKLRTRAHDERKKKKSKARAIWKKLKAVTKKAKTVTSSDASVDPGYAFRPKKAPVAEKSPEETKAKLAEQVKRKKSQDTTKLAARILSKEAKSEDSEAKKAPAFDDASHPLYQYAIRQKEAARAIIIPNKKSKELNAKADVAMEHFAILKTNHGKRKDDLNGGDDTFGKWDARVGVQLRGFDKMARQVPANEYEMSMLEESETEAVEDDSVQAAAEDLVGEMVRGERLKIELKEL